MLGIYVWYIELIGKEWMKEGSKEGKEEGGVYYIYIKKKFFLL